MTTALPFPPRQRRHRLQRLAPILAALWLAPLAAAFSVQLELVPIDAAIYVDGQQIEKPQPKAGLLKLALADQKTPHQVRFERPGFEPLTLPIGTSLKGTKQTVALTELRTCTVQIDSDCREARVALITDSGLEDWGAVPAAKEIVLRRLGGKSTWVPVSFSVAAAGYQTEIAYVSGPDRIKQTVPLARIREIASVPVLATDEGGQPLAVVARVDDKLAAEGLEPRVELEFHREAKDKAWNDHVVSVEDPQGVFQSASARVGYTQRNGPITFTLKPVKEAVLVPKVFPRVSFASGRPTQDFDRASFVAVLDTEEPCPAAAEVVRITNFNQREKKASTPQEHLNTFAVSPDGKFILLAVTAETSQGFVSSLYAKTADKDAREKQLLLENPGYIDTAPSIAPDGEDVLVFQSNRYERTKPDIFAIRLSLQDGELATRGGLMQLTGGSWFNFAPAPGSFSSTEIVCLTADPLASGVAAQVRTVRIDGAFPTVYPQRGNHVNMLERRKVVITATSPVEKRTRLLVASLDDRTESTLAAVPPFATANCSMATACPDGSKRVLFVSDAEKTTKGRPQNDIFLLRADGTVRRLTANESDDLIPAWSPLPSEPDIVYFLSNRGGAYNVWKMRIAPES